MSKERKKMVDAILKIVQEKKALRMEQLEAIMSVEYGLSHVETREYVTDLDKYGSLVVDMLVAEPYGTFVAMNTEEMDKLAEKERSELGLGSRRKPSQAGR